MPDIYADIYKTFYIGVNVLVVRDGKLLLGKRKNISGDGTWGLPGGHLEVEEGMRTAAERELMEETGLRAESFDFSNIVRDMDTSHRYIQIGFVAQGVSGEVSLNEPDRCAEWRWFPLGELPKDQFPPHIKQINNFLNKSLIADG